jgi:hypothetical protein
VTTQSTQEPKTFAEAVATLPVRAIRRFVVDAVLFIDRYSQSETGSEERLKLVLEMSEQLRPIPFPSRLEPRASITAAWREATSLAETKFFEAVDALLRDEDGHWAARQVSALLELLAESGVVVPSATVFLAQGRLKADYDRWGNPGPLSALMAMVPNDATSIFSMLDRLDADGMLAPAAVQAGVRKVCKWEPESLERSLALFGHQLFPEEEEPDAVRFFLEDLIERAGSASVVLAITGIDPDISPKLVSAAFGGDGAPFGLVLEFDGEESDIESDTSVLEGTRILSLHQLGEAAREPEWTLKVRLLSAAKPLVKIVETNPSGGVDFDEQYDEILEHAEVSGTPLTAEPSDEHESFASQFAQKMQLRVLA